MPTTLPDDGLDLDAPITEMTIGEFLNAIRHDEAREQIAKYEADLKERIRRMNEAEEQAKSIFENVKGLTHVTSPFEITSKEQADKFMESMRVALDGGDTVVISMGLKSKDGQFRR